MARRYADVQVSTKEVINSVGGMGPYRGLIFLDIINNILRHERYPVKFFIKGTDSGITLTVDETNPDNYLNIAHKNNKFQEEGILFALKTAGYELTEDGYLTPKEEDNKEEEEIVAPVVPEAPEDNKEEDVAPGIPVVPEEEKVEDNKTVVDTTAEVQPKTSFKNGKKK